jgi:DNA-binding Lrp family transcriptional regulator
LIKQQGNAANQQKTRKVTCAFFMKSSWKHRRIKQLAQTGILKKEGVKKSRNLLRFDSQRILFPVIPAELN